MKHTSALIKLAGTITLAATLTFSGFNTAGVLAEENTSTSSPLKQAKQSVSNLIASKDTDNKNSLAYRIIAFNEVLELAASESLDLKTKLAGLSVEKPLQTWKLTTIEKLNDALSYYDYMKRKLKAKEIKSLDEIKQFAENFKTERDNKYIAHITGAAEFVYLQETKTAIRTAGERQVKIEYDITQIENIRGKTKALLDIKNMLEDSNAYLMESQNNLIVAEAQFLEKNNLLATSTPSSTPAGLENETSTSTLPLNLVSETPTSSPNIATSTENEVPPPPPASIKDLVKDSLTKVREVYRIFIETSSLVRKLP